MLFQTLNQGGFCSPVCNESLGSSELDLAERKAKRAYYQANKEAVAAQRKAYREVNKEAVAAGQKAYREANKEALAASNRAYREVNKEAVAAQKKAYYQANKEGVAARSKAYYQANKEAGTTYRKAYYQANKEGVAACIKTWRKANPHVVSALVAKRRCSKLQRTPAWAKGDPRIKEIYRQAKLWGMHVDHVIPLQGKLVSGLHCWENLQLMHGSENSSKGNHFEPLAN